MDGHLHAESIAVSICPLERAYVSLDHLVLIRGCTVVDPETLQAYNAMPFNAKAIGFGWL
jgi:hypothetical protein